MVCSNGTAPKKMFRKLNHVSHSLSFGSYSFYLLENSVGQGGILVSRSCFSQTAGMPSSNDDFVININLS
ncbi:hypothetical protein THF1A12_150046 [Vibrio jasicida]|uniref:Uncharacterized protein n=1 Tax=Vibrio jasicida TaxID=766224 RepID=A0AAU9QIV1_9VIBR|nr:hypothetical protein THF1A12_150046 [Vibrio jasicida]